MSNAVERLVAFALLFIGGCELAYPEVIAVNATNDQVLLKNVSFNGCVWAGVLSNGQATSPGRCLPGTDRVHFQKFDAADYCREQAEDGTIDGVCPCGTAAQGRTDAGTSPTDPGLVDATPTWFNYQTRTAFTVDCGDFQRFEIRLDDIEQDFSIPGPYGH